jgi:hypothetical protein
VVHELDLVHRALRILAADDSRWGSNLFIFEGMTDTARATWWLRAQTQAERGVPSMQTLVNAFVAERLTS